MLLDLVDEDAVWPRFAGFYLGLFSLFLSFPT